MERGKLAMIAVIVIMVAAIAATVAVNIEEYERNKPINPDNVTVAACAEHGIEPFFVAFESGHFLDRGVNVRIIVKESESDVLDSLERKEAEIGAFGTYQFLHMIDKHGGKYKLVGRFSLENGTFGATVTDGKYADFKFDGKTSLIGAGIGVDLDTSFASAVLNYIEKTGQQDNYVIHASTDTYDSEKINVYDVKDGEIANKLSEKEHVDIVVGGAAVVNVVESNTSAFKYVTSYYEYDLDIPVSIYASSDTYINHSGVVTEVLNGLYDACSDLAADEGSDEKERSIQICMNNLNVSYAVAHKYLEITAWSMGYTAGVDKMNIECVFKYSVIINPKEYTDKLSGKDIIDIDPYVYLDCIPE